MNQLAISNIEYLIPVVAGTILFGLLCTFIIYFILLYRKSQQKLQLEKERIKHELLRVENEVQEQTLNNVSRELHDNFGQITALIKMNLNMLSLKLTGEELQRTREMLNYINQLITDIKALSSSLKGERIQKLGWVNAIEQDVQRINSLNKMNVQFTAVGTSNLTNDKEVILFRIIQELLNNSLKHSMAQQSELSILCEDKTTKIQYTDNGIGFDVHSIKRGAGLNNIEERCRMIGAQLFLSSEKDKGMSAKIELEHGD